MKTDPLEFGHILFHSQSIERAGYSQKSTQETRSKAHLWIYKDLIRTLIYFIETFSFIFRWHINVRDESSLMFIINTIIHLIQPNC